MTLAAADFAGFVADVHPGRDPFPWQQALVDTIVKTGRWPDGVDVPTGLGKTALLDVAVFLAAAAPEVARRRIMFVVDRRLVVDEAYQHALRIQHALALAAPGSIAGTVAQLLRVDGDDGPVLEVTRMRGGATWDRLWLDRPDRTAIVTATIDQVGSRLLFRGYGVSEHARSIDAALVGTDSLLIVDEAHLAEPFLITLADAVSFDTWALTRAPIVVPMSATTPADTGQVHRIGPEDEAHPIAGPRLRAAKRLHLVEVKTTKTSTDTAMADAISDMAATAPGLRAALVNTVGLGRAVFTRLRARGIDTVLLTGRIRGVDRDYLLADYYPRLAADRDRSTDTPLVLVATQTVEVGANIDVDTLITESASWPALVQRLGRLDRLGSHPDAVAVVVHPSSATTNDPVYGPARAATWDWLIGHSTLHSYRRGLEPATLTDGLAASPAELRHLATDAPAELREPRPYTPVLLPATLDAWTRTSPTPRPDPPVAPYLHGIADAAPAVGIVWRSELDTAPTDRWPAALHAVPPASDETLEVPVAAVRRWLTSATTDPSVTDLADQDRPDAPHEPAATRPARVNDNNGRPLVLRYRDRSNTEVITAAEIRPGDLIVVPTWYGGCDRYGWDPTSTDPVVDVADLADRHANPILRLGPALTTAAGAYHHDLPGEALAALAAVDPDDPAAPAACRRLLTDLAATTLNTPLGRALRRLAADTRIIATNRDETGYPALLTTGGMALAGDDTEASSAIVTGQPMPLDGHQTAVAARARQFATNLGLPADIVTAVELAASGHDTGKIDPRFQTMLHGGDRLAAEIAEQPLAKSGINPADRAAFRRALRRSGYPTGMRHEALSARIAAHRLAAGDDDVDVDLVVHLIAAHHGRSRPLLPPVTDPAPQAITVGGVTVSTADTVDWSAPRRFAGLNTRYGRWGLALLETIVRLADIYCSARNEDGRP
ncbi:type I-U CRISPR-associated helicase/endonuclease Cas3 [Catellatospora citrea]|uniref:type I-G CRISPR-associated helicase/endonuclease Cas3g n=1 Tax=Catellatospora citrea TaxID=53366 RepID=UPI0033F10F20